MRRVQQYRQAMSSGGKENYPLNRAPFNRKYHYTSECNDQQQSPNIDPHSLIMRLERELDEERKKCKHIEEQTIKEQLKVLEQINLLEQKFNQVEGQKRELKAALKQKESELEEYKKIKGMGKSLVDMMRKVEGSRGGDVHTAWRWVKKVVWEYENIKSKAMEWKAAYDSMKDINQTFSNASDSFSGQ